MLLFVFVYMVRNIYNSIALVYVGSSDLRYLRISKPKKQSNQLNHKNRSNLLSSRRLLATSRMPGEQLDFLTPAPHTTSAAPGAGPPSPSHSSPGPSAPTRSPYFSPSLSQTAPLLPSIPDSEPDEEEEGKNDHVAVNIIGLSHEELNGQEEEEKE